MIDQERGLKYKFSSKSSYIIGEPVILGFSLENPTDEELLVLKWYTPFEGVLGRIFTIKCGDRELLYNGPMVKRGDPDSSDYIRLGPKEAIYTEVDLSRNYDFRDCDECSIEFQGRIYDVASTKDLVPKRTASHVPIDAEGDIIRFRMTNP